ncbi:MAG: kynurenine formamidase [Halobacteriales archaeon]
MTAPNGSGPTVDGSTPEPEVGPTVYDLTQPVTSGIPVYPGDPPVAIEPHATMAEDGYRTSALSLGSHAGTHVDAPAHTEPDGKTLDEIDVEAFRFDAAVIDCTDVGRRAAISRETIETADPPTGANAVLLHTGWDEHWGTDRYRDHPFLAPAAAEWLADAGYHVGVDAFGPDPTPPAENESGVDGDESDAEPTGIPAHHALLGAERFIVENLRGLDRLPDRVTLHAYPVAIEDADGAPVRAVAVVD